MSFVQLCQTIHATRKNVCLLQTTTLPTTMEETRTSLDTPTVPAKVTTAAAETTTAAAKSTTVAVQTTTIAQTTTTYPTKTIAVCIELTITFLNYLLF